MGILADSYGSSYGKFKMGELGSQPTGWALPIFRDPEWKRTDPAHWCLMSRLKVLKGFKGQVPVTEKQGRYKGEDQYGYGIHSNGTIDCINIPLCSKLTVGTDWSLSSLWELESTYQEREDENNKFSTGYQRMLNRLVVTVRVEGISQYRIDKIPQTHLVVVNGGPGFGTTVSDGVSGRLVSRLQLSYASLDGSFTGAVVSSDPSEDRGVIDTLAEYSGAVKFGRDVVGWGWKKVFGE